MSMYGMKLKIGLHMDSSRSRGVGKTFWSAGRNMAMRSIAIGACVLTLALRCSAWTSNDLGRVDSLISTGKHAEALEEVRRLQQSLPGSERLTAWELDFGTSAHRLVHGKQCLYYLLYRSVWEKNEHEGVHTLDTTNVTSLLNLRGEYVVVCVDLKTGRTRWARAIGDAHLAVDMRNDVLYAYGEGEAPGLVQREGIVSLAPDSGEVVDLQAFPRRNDVVIRGLLFGPHLSPGPPNGAIGSDLTLFVYDPSTKQRRTIAPSDYWLLAPDESCRLRWMGGYDCLSLPDGQKRWSFDGGGDWNVRMALWHGDHPVFLTGWTPAHRSTVTAVDLSSGKPRWSTVLGWGGYDSLLHYDNGGERESWMPLAALDKHLLAVGNEGHLYLLDPETGKPGATAQLAHAYLSIPFQYDRQLIVSSFKWVRSYSMAGLIAPDSSATVLLQARQAGCLNALGKANEALALLDSLVERAPRSIVAWRERIAVCQSLTNSEEEAVSRCQVLSLSAQTSDDTLRSRWGLLRQYDLDAKPARSLARSDGMYPNSDKYKLWEVYAGTQAGTLWKVNTGSLEMSPAGRLDHEVDAMSADPVVVRLLNGLAKRPVPAQANQYEQVPEAWCVEGPMIGRAVAYRGRKFRPWTGGVSVLAGSTITRIESPLEKLGLWEIHLAPEGALGYGAGVFELDNDFLPVRWLIRPLVGGKKADGTEVLGLRSTRKHIGVLVNSSAGLTLQVYSREGVLLNEAPLGHCYLSKDMLDAAQFITLGDGYLFSDRQLVWISATAGGRVWRFGRSPPPRTSLPRYYDNPLVADGCLYVTSFDGRLYVFDVAQVTTGL